MWHSGVIDGHWYEAKVYDEGSQFGINGGRVSKLHICRGPVWNYQFEMFVYDRGLDQGSLDMPIVKKILAHLEHLPRSA